MTATKQTLLGSFYTVLFACLIASMQQASAQPLHDIIKSKTFRDAASTNGPLPMPSWLSTDSNFYTLFQETNTEHIIKILGKEVEGYRLIRAMVNRDQQFKEFRLYYESGIHHSQVEVLVYMPHPALFDLASTKSLVEQNALIPLSPESAEPFELDGLQWTFYELKDGTFKFIMDLPMQSMVVLRVKKEEDARDARELIRKLNVHELEHYLSS